MKKILKIMISGLICFSSVISPVSAEETETVDTPETEDIVQEEEIAEETSEPMPQETETITEETSEEISQESETPDPVQTEYPETDVVDETIPEEVAENAGRDEAILSDTVTVSFNSNSEDAIGEMPAQKFTAGEPQSLNANTFERDGYDFVFWNTNPNAEGDTYTDGQEMIFEGIPASDITLYAQWKKTETVSEAEISEEISDEEGSSDEAEEEFFEDEVSEEIIQEGGITGVNDGYSAESLDESVYFENYKEIEAVLVSGLESRNRTISLSRFGLSPADLKQVLTITINRNPQLFYVGIDYQYSLNKTYAVKTFKPRYKKEYSSSALSELNAAADRLLSGMDYSWSDELKVIYLHDTIVTNVDYDGSGSRFTAYDSLVGGSSVCQGYALGFLLLCRKAGIDCDVISSKTLNHIWNTVVIDGHVYSVDCTWDDPMTSTRAARYTYACKHENLLSSNYQLSETGHYSSDWVNSESVPVYGICSNTDYDQAWFKNAITPLVSYNGEWYFMDEFGNTVNAYSYSTGMARTVSTVEEDAWPLYGSDGDYYARKYWGLCSDGRNIYVSSPYSIYSTDPSETVRKIFTLSNEDKNEGSIYGIYIADDSHIAYNLQRGPGKNEYVKTGYTSSSFIHQGIESIAFSQKEMTVYTGDTAKASVIVTPDGFPAENIVWSSSDNSVVTVDAAGTITGISAGTAVITAAASDGVYDVCTVSVLSSAPVIKLNVPENGYVYNGSAFRPEVSVSVKGKELRNTDFIVSYRNNTKAGKATVRVKIKGKKSETYNLPFEIHPADLEADGLVITNPALARTGRTLKPKITVSLNGQKLKEGKDYSLIAADGKKLKDEGVYPYLLKGIGNYSGQKTINVTVTDRASARKINAMTTSISKASYTVKTVMSTGKPVTAEDACLKLTYKKKPLAEGQDYRILSGSYKNNVTAGTASVYIEGIGAFSGTKKITFRIKQSSR